MRRMRIEHTTTYTYSNPVDFGTHRLLLRPREGHDIRIETSKLEIDPKYTIHWHRDAYNNSVGVVSFSKPAPRLKIFSETVIQNYEDAPLDFIVAEYAVNFPFHYDPTERTGLMPFLLSIYPDDSFQVRDWLFQFWKPGQIIETYVFLDIINKAISNQFEYMVREEPGVQSPAATLSGNTGSCRDFATLFMEACRYVGLAARFVSGYLHCEPTEKGHGATHAWAEVYLPGPGWKGFDPTSGELVGNNHIPVAVNRHPEAVPPISGSFMGKLSQPPAMEVNLRVAELDQKKPTEPSFLTDTEKNASKTTAGGS
ncbi:MAG: transglutaminase family protein [Thermodesulfobacteriota bacterium]